MNCSGFDADKREKDDVFFRNRRADIRLNHEINVDFEVSVDGPHSFFTGITQDISKGGVFLATHQIYPIGTNMKLSFVIEGASVTVDAVVRWIRSPENITGNDILPGMGLQFLSPGTDVIKAFDKFLEKKEPLLVDVEE